VPACHEVASMRSAAESHRPQQSDARRSSAWSTDVPQTETRSITLVGVFVLMRSTARLIAA
jgi:hypothetical protein